MKKQAKLMQSQLNQTREQLEQTEVTGSAGNSLVKITLDGSKNLKKIKIQRECLTDGDSDGLEDLILAAFEDANKKIESLQKQINHLA